MAVIFGKVKPRRDTISDFVTSEYVPENGEIIGVMDEETGLGTAIKFGNGQQTVDQLPALSKGDKGDTGAPGSRGLPGVNAVPAADFVEAVAPTVPRAWFLDAYRAFMKGWQFQAGQGTSATTTTASAASGTTTLTVVSGASFPNGTVIVTGEATDQQQVNKVAAGGGTTTLTLVNPLDFAVASGAQIAPLWGNDGHMNTDAGAAGWKAFARFIMEARRADGSRVINRTGKIVFFGNSWMTTSNTAIYTAAVTAVYPDAQVVIAGISGNNSGQLLARFSTDVPADADFVIMPEPGVNASVSENRVLQLQNLNKLIDRVRGIGAVPVFTGPVPVSTNAVKTAQQEADQTAAFAAVPYLSVIQQTASGSTAFGFHALENDTQDSNTAFGTSALANSTSGVQNTFFGQYAGLNSTTGGFNTGVGQGVLQSNVSGTNNTAVGRQVLTNSTANANTGVGDEALKSATTGGSNTALGRQAGSAVTTGSSNVLIGVNAGQAPNFNTANATTTGSSNVFLGPYSGQASPTQRNNATAIGSGALVDGDRATSIGSGATAGHTDGVAIGAGSTTSYRHMEITQNAGLIPTNPAAGKARVFVRDNGSGKMQLAAIFPTGAIVPIVTEA
jgi:hypothetical protein